MKYANVAQIQKLHVLLNKLGIIDEKQQIVYNTTEGRTTSSKELSFDEARQLIMSLSEYDPKERIKSLVFSLAYKAGIIYGSTDTDKKINTAKLNLFIREKGTIKKNLNEMDYSELIKTHRQFEAIVKNNQKSKDKKQADNLVTNLLNELNLNTL